jgi:two-component system, LytTR family, response regulator
MNLKVLIVDDEPLSCNRVKRFLKSYPIASRVQSIDDATVALRTIAQENPDVLFLDVEMPGLNGFEMLQRIPFEKRPYIIFITAFEHYAVRAFDVQAVDYLLKPFSRPRFDEAMQRLLHHLETDSRSPIYANRLAMRSGDEFILINVNDIDWIEAARHSAITHVNSKQLLSREGITELLARLDPSRFVRIHRSYAVNIDRIQKLQPLFHGDYRVVLHDGTKLMLSRRYKERLQHLLGRSL